jgi:hypothetical protein
MPFINMSRASLLGGVLLVLFGTTAMGGLNGVDVRITNDGTDDIVVTVYDTTTEPRHVVLANERINGFTTIPISLVADEGGRANLSWTAVTADPNGRKCGHESNSGLTDSASVHVHADSACSGV